MNPFAASNLVELSFSESATLLRRALFALDVPAGFDSESAESIAWLALTDATVLNELPHLWKTRDREGAVPQPEISSSDRGVAVITMGQDGGLTTSPFAVDEILATSNRSASHISKSVLRNLKYPALLFPQLCRRSTLGYSFQIDIDTHPVLIADNDIWAKLSIGEIASITESVSVEVTCRISKDTTASDLLTYNNLSRCGPVNRRVCVPHDLYLELKAIALQSMVPVSAHSREKGAGAGEIDND